MNETFFDGRVTLHHGDSRDVLRSIADASIDSVVTDPPYALVSIGKRLGKPGSAPAKHGSDGLYARASAGFMGQAWDTGETAFAVEFWVEVLRVLKPGGHLVAFSGTRTYHRMACAIEDAGFEIRDMLGYLYGCGFPKSHNIYKAARETICRCASGDDPVRGMRKAEDNPCGLGEAREEPDVFSAMQRRAAWSGMGEARSERGEGAYEGELCEGGAVRSEQPGVEGWCNLPEPARKLCERPLREVSARVRADGAQGRLCDGAPSSDGTADRPLSDTYGVCSSPRSSATQQFQCEPGTLAGQPQPQDGRAWDHCERCGKPILPEGLGTALKPALEPVCFARKPIVGTVAANVLVHGTGGINIDACRVGVDGGSRTIHGDRETKTVHAYGDGLGAQGGTIERPKGLGRWPANVVHDGSDDVIDAFPADGSDTAARFFYSAKADAHDRIGSKHPTVKPVDLMQWLCRLVTPKGGIVLDPFAGSGTTGEAAWRGGFRAVLIEREAAYCDDIRRRMRLATSPAERAAVAKARGVVEVDAGPLFGASDTPPQRRRGRRIGPTGLRR